VVLWIVIGVVVLSLVILLLALRALAMRMKSLQAEQVRLAAGAAKAQQLAEVAQGLQAHADSLKLRADIAAQQVEQIKRTRAEFSARAQ
jgi:flagellar biosynthesis/type III secretory pathway M-ring protein FliF/YscJ